MKEVVGVVGMGSFGVAVADLLSENADVLLYTRNTQKAQQFNTDHTFKDFEISSNVKAISDLQVIGDQCSLIFVIVPSEFMRETMINLSPFLNPSKVIIHGTKGLDIGALNIDKLEANVRIKEHIKTMSQVIQEESSIVRVGCMAGPNLAIEILKGQPAATVIGSEFDEVIHLGQRYLSSKRFYSFGTYDIYGVEFAGILKNIFALASGILSGFGYGKNIQAMLISRGLREMIALGHAFGSNTKAFFGTAGIGDLVATATSTLSRNYRFGHRMGKGESYLDVLNSTSEVVEGLRTLMITYGLINELDITAPITEMIYKVVYEEYDIEKAIHFLMKYPRTEDVDFL